LQKVLPKEVFIKNISGEDFGSDASGEIFQCFTCKSPFNSSVILTNSVSSVSSAGKILNSSPHVPWHMPFLIVEARSRSDLRTEQSTKRQNPSVI
jgi:hypothetical protein